MALWTGGSDQYIKYRVARGVCYIKTYLSSCRGGWYCPKLLPKWARPGTAMTFAGSVTTGAGNNTAWISIESNGKVWADDYIPSGATSERSHTSGCWPVHI